MEYWLDLVVANALGIFGLVALGGVAGMLVSTAAILHAEAKKLTAITRQRTCGNNESRRRPMVLRQRDR